MCNNRGLTGYFSPIESFRAPGRKALRPVIDRINGIPPMTQGSAKLLMIQRENWGSLRASLAQIRTAPIGLEFGRHPKHMYHLQPY